LSTVLSLGVDVGSTNVKAVLMDLDDGPDPRPRTVASAASPTPDDGTALIARVLTLIEELVAKAGRAPLSIGVASMAETGVPLDDEDRPIGPLVRWDGRRGQQDADALAATYGATELFTATGTRPSGKVPLATWAYLRRCEPDRWAALRRWAGAADLVVLALTGRLVTDHTLAGRTMAYRLPEEGSSLPIPDGYDPELLAAVGLRPQQLPEVVRPGGIAGLVHAGRPAGLSPGTPVVVAGHDHAVGAWACGVREPEQVADSVGTAESMVRVIDSRPDPAAVLAAGMSLVRTVGGDHEALVAGSSSAGAMLPWWRDRIAAGRPIREVFHGAGRNGPTGLFVLPYLNGRQAPWPDPQARPRLVGDATGRDLRDLAGALLDGLSLHARWMQVEQARLAGVVSAPEVVVLGSATAGGSAWLRTKAAVGPSRLRTVAEAEPVAAGAALLAAGRAGLVEDGPGLVLASVAVPGNPQPAYHPIFAAFVEAALVGKP
jgi:sugar (pentulose or hexulose) kinase